MTDVTLTHPDSPQEIQVDASLVATYASQGWEIAPAAKAPDPAAPTTDTKAAK